MDKTSLSKEQLYNAVNLTATITVSDLARERNIPATKMLLIFMHSNTASVLYDLSTRFWCDGPSAVENAFNLEMLSKTTNYSVQSII